MLTSTQIINIYELVLDSFYRKQKKRKLISKHFNDFRNSIQLILVYKFFFITHICGNSLFFLGLSCKFILMG